MTSWFFNLIPKNLWYITWTYSSWDNLSNREFFEQEPASLGMNPRAFTMFYKKAILYRTDPHIEDSVLNLERVTPVAQPVDKEFKVEFSQKPIDLNNSKK